MIMSRRISLRSLGAVNSHLNHSGDKRDLALAELWKVAGHNFKKRLFKKWDHSAALIFFVSLSSSNSCLWGAKCKIWALRKEPSGNHHSLLSSALLSPRVGLCFDGVSVHVPFRGKSHGRAPGAHISHSPLGDEVWLAWRALRVFSG